MAKDLNRVTFRCSNPKCGVKREVVVATGEERTQVCVVLKNLGWVIKDGTKPYCSQRCIDSSRVVTLNDLLGGV